MFENRVLRGIFVPNRDEVTRKWRKLHNEELNDLYCSPNIFRELVKVLDCIVTILLGVYFVLWLL